MFNTPNILQGDKRLPDVSGRKDRQVACNRKPKGVSPNTRRQVPDMLHEGGGTGQPTLWHNSHNKTGQRVSKTRGCDRKRARHLRNLPQERFTRHAGRRKGHQMGVPPQEHPTQRSQPKRCPSERLLEVSVGGDSRLPDEMSRRDRLVACHQKEGVGPRRGPVTT